MLHYADDLGSLAWDIFISIPIKYNGREIGLLLMGGQLGRVRIIRPSEERYCKVEIPNNVDEDHTLQHIVSAKTAFSTGRTLHHHATYGSSVGRCGGQALGSKAR